MVVLLVGNGLGNFHIMYVLFVSMKYNMYVCNYQIHTYRIYIYIYRYVYIYIHRIHMIYDIHILVYMDIYIYSTRISISRPNLVGPAPGTSQRLRTSSMSCGAKCTEALRLGHCSSYFGFKYHKFDP